MNPFRRRPSTPAPAPSEPDQTAPPTLVRLQLTLWVPPDHVAVLLNDKLPLRFRLMALMAVMTQKFHMETVKQMPTVNALEKEARNAWPTLQTGAQIMVDTVQMSKGLADLLALAREIKGGADE